MKRYIPLICIVILGLVVPQAWVFADNRALLIGVGKFKDPNIKPLEGIEHDITMMREVAGLMGYRDDQIKVMQNHEATYAAVKQAFEDWIIQQVGPNDKAFIYFSGHGSQIKDYSGDENDNLDEFLVVYDTSPTRLTFLLDDELNRLLTSIKSKNVLAVMDCCHSGTNTKALNLETNSLHNAEFRPKFFRWPPKDDDVFKSLIRRKDSMHSPVIKEKNYVTISACKDTEMSLASSYGSIFTLGVYSFLKKISGSGKDLVTITTPDDLRIAAAEYVDKEIQKPANKFTPQISGNLALAHKAIPLKVGTVAPIWRELAAIADKAQHKLPFRLNKDCYEMGDLLIMDLNIPGPGYLNIVSIDTQDRATVLFPNKEIRDNKVEKGALAIPNEKMTFQLRALEPGPIMVTAFWTSQDFDFYQQGLKTRQQLFATLSVPSRAAFGVESVSSGAHKNQLWACKVETRIAKKSKCP